MKTRTISECQLCGKARLEIALTHGLCRKCRRACDRYGENTPITIEGLHRLLDDLDIKKDFPDSA